MKLLTPPSFFSQTRLPCISWPSPNWTPDSSHSSLQRPPGRVSLSAQLVFTRLIPSIFVHFSPGGMMPPPHFFLYSSSSIWRPKHSLVNKFCRNAKLKCLHTIFFKPEGNSKLVVLTMQSGHLLANLKSDSYVEPLQERFDTICI